MSSFTVNISTDNAAFDGGNLADEIARALRTVAYRLDHGHTDLDRADHREGANVGTVVDDNGNTCGRWFWTDRTAKMDDSAALDWCAAFLSGEEWEAGTIEDVAERIRDTGREILDFTEADPGREGDEHPGACPTCGETDLYYQNRDDDRISCGACAWEGWTRDAVKVDG